MGRGNRTILWRRFDVPGHEFASVREGNESCLLRGTAVFAHEGEPCWLEYAVICDRDWTTKSARVDGFVGNRPVAVKLSVHADGTWELNGSHCARVDGCIDVDLNFSPSTNLLPVRRLGLGVGDEASTRAAWLRFPQFTLEPLDQTYSRLAENTYRYSSASGFSAELEVDDAGFTTRYGSIWISDAP